MKLHNRLDMRPPDEIRGVQDTLLRETVERAYEHSPYYRGVLRDSRLKPSDISGLDGLAGLPFTRREDFQMFNQEFLSVDKSNIAEMVSTTGTTGDPVFIAMTAGDLTRLAYNEEKSFTNAGVQKGDLYHLAVTCDNLFIAGIAYYSGLLRLGASVVRVGAQNMDRHLELIKKLRPEGVVAVPSYMVQLARRAESQGVDLREHALRKIVLIGDSIRSDDFTSTPLGRLIENAFGNICYSTYGITEGQVSFCECHYRRGLHSHPDLVIAEIVDDRGDPVSDGETGELVLTTLQIEGMPLLRYKTGDITFKLSAPCECGRNSARIGPVLGRKHHRLKLKGVTLYPKTIENAILELEDIVNYQIEAYTGDDHTDRILLRIGTHRNGKAFERAIQDRIRAKARVSPGVELTSPDELKERLFAGGSRKAITFKDLRSRN